AEAEADLRRATSLKDELIEARSRQDRLRDPEQESDLSARMAAAEAALQEAEEKAREADQAEARDRTLQSQEDAARERLEGYDRDLAALEDLRSQIGHTDARIAELRETAGMTSKRATDARAKRESAARHLAALQKQLEAKRVYLGAQAAAAERTSIEQKLERLRSIKAEADVLQKMASRRPLDAEKLATLERRVHEAEARRLAAAPEVELIEGDASLDGRDLSRGIRQPVTGEGVIAVGGTQLRLHLRNQTELDETYSAAQNALQAFLQDVGASDGREARQQDAERREAAAALAALLARMEELAPEGLPALEARLDQLPAEDAGEDPAPERSETELTKLAEAATIDAAECERAADLANTAELADAHALQTAEVELRVLHDKAQDLAARLGPEQQRTSRREGHRRALDDLLRERELHAAALAGLAQRREALAFARTGKERLQKSAEARRRDLQALRERIAHLEGQLEASYRGNPEQRLAAARDELARAEEDVEHWEKERRALSLLSKLFVEEEEGRRGKVIAPVLSRAEPMLRHLLGPSELRFDSELNPEVLDREGVVHHVAELSAGTQEQISIITRLAYAELLAEEGRPFPVILDDPVVYADDQRRERLFDLLSRAAERTQIIIFTCHEDAFRDLGAHPLQTGPFEEG
ncbi:MAG: hypothetical protein V2I43_05180, partial [Parvularcula sp.]|nr:hypothetical protein [Parvularcula sp.]